MHTVLVCFHAADKDIPKIGQFTKERGLINSQFHMTGEAAQSWQKVKGKKEQVTILHGMGQPKRACAGKLCLIKLSDLMRLIHYHKNRTKKPCPHDSITYYQVTPTTSGNSR